MRRIGLLEVLHAPSDRAVEYLYFLQVDTSETRTYSGIGLGLSLARQFVEMHGGQIWVESESGKGAKFTIVIPYG